LQVREPAVPSQLGALGVQTRVRQLPALHDSVPAQGIDT
jgi:hypothetical protein